MPPSAPSDTDAADTDARATDEQIGFSRRQVLAAAGASGVLGGVVGAVLGPRFDASSGATGECDSTPLSTARHPWPHPEADAARTGHVSERQMPTSLDPGWSVALERDQFHTTLVADGAILLPEQWDGDRGGRFVAFDPEDGTERWRTDYQSYRPNTATVAGDAVFALREDGLGALALADGTDRWQAGDASELTNRIANPAPVVAGGHVVVQASGDDGSRFETYDSQTGGRCGTTATDYEGLYGPAVSGTQAFFIYRVSTLLAFSLTDWSLNWTRSLDPSAIGLPRVADGVVYTGGEGLLAALDPADGSTLWSREFPSRSSDGGDDEEIPISSIVAVTPDAIVALGPNPEADGSGADGDGITAFSRADGSTLWHRAPGQAYRYSIAAAGDTLYVAFFDSETHQYRMLELVTATGELRDSTTLRVGTPLEVVVGDGRLYVVGSSGIESRGG